MGNSDLSTDVSLGGLTPPASVRPVGSNSPNQEAPPKPRRPRHDQEARESDDEDPSSESDAGPQHQIDRLA